jgi:hypothetical protein
MKDTKNLLVVHLLNWIHIRLLNDVILITSSLDHRDLLDVQISDFSGLTGFLRYIGCSTSGVAQRAMREAAPPARGVSKARQL